MGISGLHVTGQGKKRIDGVLQELFPTSSANGKVHDEDYLVKAYHKYKRDYVKLLSFTPKTKNLGEHMFYGI